MSATTQRLLAVIELLQSHHEMTGAEIADRLGVDTRSVRRYIKSLQDMGIPVEGERGRYGAYRLNRGYKLPPLMFTAEEAVALTLGLMTVRAFHFPVDPMSGAGALAKVERVLPEPLLNRTRALQETLYFDPITPPTAVENAVLTTLTNAAGTGTRLHLVYRAWKDEITERNFDPYGVVFHEGYWYASGHCHLRQDLRTFRVDRIQRAALTDATFTRPPDFDVLTHVQTALSNPAGVAQVEVLLLTSLATAQRSLPPELGTFEEVEAGVMFRRPAYRLEWVAPMLLSLDFPIRILNPPELRERIHALGEKALQMSSIGA